MAAERHGKRRIVVNVLAAHNRLFEVAACCPHLRPHRPLLYALLGDVAGKLLVVIRPDILEVYNVAIRLQTTYRLHIVTGSVYHDMVMQPPSAVLAFGSVYVLECLTSRLPVLLQVLKKVAYVLDRTGALGG